MGENDQRGERGRGRRKFWNQREGFPFLLQAGGGGEFWGEMPSKTGERVMSTAYFTISSSLS